MKSLTTCPQDAAHSSRAAIETPCSNLNNYDAQHHKIERAYDDCNTVTASIAIRHNDTDSTNRKKGRYNVESLVLE